MINILEEKAIKYFIDSNKKLFDATYVDQRDRIKCKIYKHNTRDYTYLYLLNNFVDGAKPYEDFMPKKYGFKYSYYLVRISNYMVNSKDFRSPFVYLIKDNKINNIKIKIK
jgi:hypothetical protein|nr:MAG TPA: hypothetical protein [Crassvirales sp.]